MQNRIKQLRDERNMRQIDLAAEINVSQQTISRIEKGNSSLPADILIDLCAFFGVSADYILCLSDSRRSYEYQLEYNRVMEQNYNLCRIYERLDEKNKQLIYDLIGQLK